MGVKAKSSKKVEYSSSSSSSSSSDSSSSSSPSSSSSSSSSSDSSDSESEKEEETKKEESSSSSSSSSSDSSDSESDKEEELKIKKDTKKESDSESSSSESDSESSDSSSDSSSSSSDSSSSDSSDSDSDSESSSEKRSSTEEAEEQPAAKKQKTEEVAEETNEEPATCFVGRLSWNIDGPWLKSEFEHIGGVIDARVIYERENPSRSRGYGYVDFKSQKFADKAVKEMHGKEIDGREINVDISTSKPAANAGNNDRARKFGDVPSEPSETLFLGNLSFDVDRDEVYKIFEEFGNIISVRLPTHPETQQLKGFGYVQYGDIESAKKAFENLQGTYIANRPVRLDYSTPKPPTAGGNDRRQGGFRGGNDRRQGGFRGGNRGERNFSTGANATPLGQRNSAPFSGQKKTFD